MNNQKFNLVLDRLLDRTIEGKLEWEKTANRNTFLAVLQESTIAISQDFEADAEFPSVSYTFDFRNENGEIVESIDVFDSVEEREIFEKANQIFDLARQQSSTVDKTLDHILEQLAA